MSTGSFFNNIMGAPVQTVPEVGMGATALLWTDRHAGTIVSVSASGKSLEWTRDDAVRTDGQSMSDAQAYAYTRAYDTPRVTYTLRKNGAWVRKGETLATGQRLGIGYRREYYDYSF